MSESLAAAGKALSATITCSSGGDISINISTDNVQVARDVCIAAVTLGALYAGYKLITRRIDVAVNKGLGGNRDDQEIREIRPGSLHVLLHCFTDERFLEVVDDFETGSMRQRLEYEFTQAGFNVEGLKVEIENMEEMYNTKEAINKRLIYISSDDDDSMDVCGGDLLRPESASFEKEHEGIRSEKKQDCNAPAISGDVLESIKLKFGLIDGEKSLAGKRTMIETKKTAEITTQCLKKEYDARKVKIESDQKTGTQRSQIEKNEMNAEILRLNLENNKKNRDMQQLQGENRAIKTNVQHLQNENRQIILNMKRLNKENNMKYTRLQEEIMKKETTIKRLQEENNQKNTHIQQLHGENNQKNKGIQQLVEENKKMNTVIQQLQEENKQQNADIQQLQEENNKKNTVIRQLEEENIQKNTVIQQLKEENNEKNRNIHKLMNENQHKSKDILRLQEESCIKIRDMQRVQEENRVIKSNMQRLQNENGQMIWNMRRLRKENDLNQIRLQEENNKKESNIRRLEEENNKMNTAIQQIQEENNRKNISIKQLQEENQKNNTNIQQLQEENCKKNTAIQQLQEENNKKNRDMQRVQGENTVIKSNVQRLRQVALNIQQLQAENTKKNTDIQRLQGEKIEKNAVIQHLQEENKEKNTLIQQLQEENNQKNTDIQRLQENTIALNLELQHLQNDSTNAMSSILAETGSVVVTNKILGRGAYASVYWGDFYGTKVAVKEFHEVILSPYNVQMLKREIFIASQCRHPNLLQFICATKNDHQRLLIVTELMDTSLRKLIEQRARARSQLVDQEVKSISLDVARGLNYLHSRTPSPIIHRDVSSANVLLWIENDAVRKAKISDYGSANFMELCNTANPGAVIYAAPEAGRARQDSKIDVYSYGVLVCEMCICEIPHPSDRERHMSKIANAHTKTMVEQCINESPQSRPTMQDVINFWEKCQY